MSWVSKAVCCLTFSQLLALSSSNPSCLEALSTKSKHWQLQYFNSFLKTDFFPLWFMLICFLCGHDQENNVIRVQVKTRTLFGSDRAWWGLERVSKHIFVARQISLSPSPSLALMDVHCSALKQMVEALRRGSSETREVKLLSLTFQYSL